MLWLAEVEAETVIDTLAEMKADEIFYALVYTLAEVES